MDTSEKPSRGVIYVATGEKYIEEAMFSAESLKRYQPGMDVTLFADKHVDSDIFDTVRILENPYFTWADKIPCFLKSPYEWTLFLDTDVFICCNIEELFILLERYDVMASEDYFNILGDNPSVPSGFIEKSTGVVLFRQSNETKSFLEMWSEDYSKDAQREALLYPTGLPGCTPTQPSFNSALYKSEVSFMTLSEKYNFVVSIPKYVTGEVRILHGRHPHIEKLAQGINNHSRPFLYYGLIGNFPVYTGFRSLLIVLVRLISVILKMGLHTVKQKFS